MLFATYYFTEILLAVSRNDYPSVSVIGGLCKIKGQKVQIEKSLYAYPKLIQSLEGLSTSQIDYFFTDVPARSIAGPLSVMRLLVSGKQVDLFMVAHGGFYIICAVYLDEPNKTIALMQDIKKAAIESLNSSNAKAA